MSTRAPTDSSASRAPSPGPTTAPDTSQRSRAPRPAASAPGASGSRGPERPRLLRSPAAAATSGPERRAPATAAAEAPLPPADRIRIGRVSSGRKLSDVEAGLRASIVDFATQRRLPGLGSLVELAAARDEGTGKALGVSEFSEIRGRLERLVADLEAIAIQVGPMLFVKSVVKSQSGTALRWLSPREREALEQKPGLLDQPNRITANLKKALAEQA